MSCGFDLEHYRELLRAATAGGYRWAFFDAEPREGDLFLRHDVDLSLDAALRLAELEAEQGAAATYFLMTESVFYNLASSEGRTAIERLRELGHRVGLHAVWPNARLDERFDPVVAWHNPDPEYMSAPVDGAVNVMQAPWFAPETYRSDSNQQLAPRLPARGARRGRVPVAAAADAPGDLGVRRRRRWARRCTRCSTRSASGASSSSAPTGSTCDDRRRRPPPFARGARGGARIAIREAPSDGRPRSSSWCAGRPSASGRRSTAGRARPRGRARRRPLGAGQEPRPAAGSRLAQLTLMSARVV